MIRRPPRSTQSRSSAASDVYKRQEMAWSDETALQPGDRVVTTLRKEGWQTIRKVLGQNLALGAARPGAEKPVVTAGRREAGEERPIRAIIGGCGRVGSQLAYILSLIHI